MLKIDDSTPSPRFLYTISHSDLSRKAASLITQLLMTHIPLNSFLKRIKKVDSARCPACGTNPETVRHFHLSNAYPGHSNRKCLTVSGLVPQAGHLALSTFFIRLRKLFSGMCVMRS